MVLMSLFLIKSVSSLLDSLTEEAQAIGAVNTVRIINNQWIGHNTDGLGFVKGLQSKYGDLSDAQILILGAGGASKGIAYALKKYANIQLQLLIGQWHALTVGNLMCLSIV